MVFSTGYQANLGIISTIAGKERLHRPRHRQPRLASMTAARWATPQIVPFRHNDIDGAGKAARAAFPTSAGKLVVLEGVYSMLGDVAPLEGDGRGRQGGTARWCWSTRRIRWASSASNGRGVAEEQGVLDEVDFVIGTFSKSVGTVGGFCVSNHPKFEILRLVCRPYVFTASLPPSVVATAATSIRKLMHGSNKRAHLWENSQAAARRPRGLGFRLGTEEPQSAIIAVIMPDLEQGAAMWEALLARRALRQPRPPARDPGRHDPAALLALRRA